MLNIGPKTLLEACLFKNFFFLKDEPFLSGDKREISGCDGPSNWPCKSGRRLVTQERKKKEYEITLRGKFLKKEEKTTYKC